MIKVANGGIRVRRPSSRDDLIYSLREEAGFETIVDVLLFAGAVGFRNNRRVSFDVTSEPVRLGTFENSEYGLNLIDMIAANDPHMDTEILDDERQRERVLIVEEYACGGLEVIQTKLNSGGISLRDVVYQLIMDGFKDKRSTGHEEIDELLRNATF